VLLLYVISFASVIACAPKIVPPPVTAPRFPDFIFPDVPADLQTAAVTDRHKAAWQFLQAGDLRNAERSFGAALKASPAFYPAEAGLGYLDLAKRDYKDAVSRFDRALARAPGYVPALIGRGEALLAAGRQPEALETLTKALAVDPSLADVRRRVEVLKFRTLEDAVSAARAAAGAGRFAEAQAAYERALAASPESAFLYRDLASVEMKLHAFDRALAHAQRSTDLDPQDVRAWIVLAEVREERGDVEEAAAAYTAARRLEPDNTEVAERLARVDERLASSRLPIEYHAIADATGVTRGELAALIGVRLEKFVGSVKQRATVLVTDTRAHWAAPWIIAVTRTGIMEAYPNHTFQPNAVVRRGDFARVAARILTLIGQRAPAIAERWRQARAKFSDLAPGHLHYPAASTSVAAGVLATEGDAFHPTRVLTGPELTAAMKRLEALAGDAQAGR
jgi:tetratricopeptide (TPR) repeat protein